MCPFTILKLSSISFRAGTIALVVHDAAASILSSEDALSSLTPKTIFLIFPFPGAVNKTLSTLGFFTCCESPSSSLHTPVLSITVALLISKSLYLTFFGLSEYINETSFPFIINELFCLFTLIVPGNGP